MQTITTTAAALMELKQALNEAPKSKKGFVNWQRNNNLQQKAVKKMMEGGESESEARKMAFAIGKPYDTTYSKH